MRRKNKDLNPDTSILTADEVKNKDLNPDTSILTADEVAEYLKLSKITVYKLAKQGSIPGFRVGGSWRFNKSFIEKMMK
jgi:excisionase family DNA binding protein